MENKNYKYNSTSVLKDWAIKRIKRTPKIVYYGFFSLCLATLCGALIGYNFYSSNLNQFASKYKNKQGQLIQELQRVEKEKEALNNKFKEVELALNEIEEKDKNIYRTIYNLKVDEDIDANSNTVNNYSAEDIEDLLTKIEEEKKSLNEVLKNAKKNDKNLTSMPVLKPVADKHLNRLASGYGSRFHPILKVNKMHNGLDFAAKTGTPIYATGDGVVKMAGRDSGFGNVVKIRHNSEYETVYAHMSYIKTRTGKKIKRGDLIGYVGSTGLSTGPHLHYEIRKNGQPIDPILYFYDDVDPDAFIKIYQKARNSTLSLD